MLYQPDGDTDDELERLMVREAGNESGQSVWNLRVYCLAHDLGVAAHRLSLQLPKYEMYESGSQLRRAAKSVSANVVEGYGRRQYKADYLRFLVFAKASLSETEEHLRYICDCHPDQREAATALLTSADHLGRRLHRFMQLVEAHHRV